MTDFDTNDSKSELKISFPDGAGGSSVTLEVTEKGLLLNDFDLVDWEWLDAARQKLTHD